MKQLLLDIAPPPAPTLENFVVGANAELLAALRGVLDGSAGERFVYLWGGGGCGKSHLLAGFLAAADALGMRGRRIAGGKDVCRADDLTACDVVAVDDALKLDADSQIGLFDLINRLRDGTGLLLVTGPFAPMHLRLRPDLATRLGQSLVYQVHCLSDEDKQRALIAHAQGRGFTLPVDAASYLLRKCKRDLSSLMAVLDALDRYSLEVKRPITVPLVREVLALLPGA
jgi:DnaA family protein